MDSRTRKGLTALAMAVQAGHTELVEALIKKKVNTNGQSRRGERPWQESALLHVCSRDPVFTRLCVPGLSQANLQAVNKKGESIMDLCKTDEMKAVIQAAMQAAEEQKAKQAEKAAQKQGGEGKRKERGNMRGGKKDTEGDGQGEEAEAGAGEEGEEAVGRGGAEEVATANVAGEAGEEPAAVAAKAEGATSAAPAAKKAKKVVLSFGEED